MNTKSLTYLTIILASMIIGTSNTLVAKQSARSQTPLTDTGRELEARYAQLLDSLKADLIKALPTVNDSKKAAFLNAREFELKAEATIKAAQEQMNAIKKAKALVDHAKGKWIGGANKGIAAARAKLKKATSDAEHEAAQQELTKWQQNLKDGEDALKERQAAYDKVQGDQPSIESTLKAAKQTLTQAKATSLESVKALQLGPFLSSDRFDAKLAKYVVLLEASPRGLAEFAQQGTAQSELIDKMLSADHLLVQMATADGATDGQYGPAIQIYSDIWQASEHIAEGPLQRLALAISLEHAVPIKQRNAVADTDAPATVNPVNRYLHFEKAFIAGELDPAFKDLSTWDYRMVVNGEEPDEILAWGREMLRTYRPDHISTSDYRWRYVAAVRSDIRYGSEDNKYDKDELQFFQNILMNGGICGRRAFFGRFILRAFGIPTTARPQTGHAALTHWTPDGWVVCLGGGWGAGWTKTRYNRDLDFLANTQARMAGETFMQVKRAQWIGDLLGEPRAFGFLSGSPKFWYGVSLYTQKQIILDAKAKTLAAVGEDIGEANETKEKVEITKVSLSEAERKITIDEKGVITIPAVATSQPTQSTGKIIFMKSHLGGKQLHYSRTGKHQDFEYKFDAPMAGTYALTARVATPSWKQNLLVTTNNAKQAVTTMALPHTVGLWEQSAPVVIELVKGKNSLRFSRQGDVKGLSIKEFTLSPIASR
mgnify:CR=1 FL=1